MKMFNQSITAVLIALAISMSAIQASALDGSVFADTQLWSVDVANTEPSKADA